MESAVLVDVVRTPIGRRNGGLAGWHPVDLVAEVLSAVTIRADLDPSLINDVITGCVTQVGAQSTNISRSAVLAAGWPERIPGTTVDRQCGSAMQAVHFAAQGVMAGAYEVVVAAGVEMMSVVPMFSNAEGNLADPYGPQVRERYDHRSTYDQRGIVPQGLSAELVAELYGQTRDDLDAFALRSHERARAARDSGGFATEIVPVRSKRRESDGSVSVGDMIQTDEGIRESTIEALSRLSPVFREEGLITAGNSSQISDGASAALIMREGQAERLGLSPLARFVGFSVAGCDPIEMLTATIPATTGVLERTGLTLDEIDLFEVNEAFASVPLAWTSALHADSDQVNVNGGAIALGHPLGATGVRLLATLAHALVNRGTRMGLQTICEGGGMANALVIESLR